MHPKRNTKVIVTLGPSTNEEAALRMIKDKGVDFVRTNMSHSSLDDLKGLIRLAKKVGLEFIIDTEGSQVRTGDLEEEVIYFRENAEVLLRADPVNVHGGQLCLRPGSVLAELEEGDLIHIDFDTLILRVSDVGPLTEGYVVARAITGGYVGRNKAVVVDPVINRAFGLPPLSEKDYSSIEWGLKEGIEHIAVSFVRSGAVVDEVREVTKHRMKIISKIECVEALENLDDIIRKSDYLLIDRGDLSKEIPVERIPMTQKIIINRAAKQGKGVFVATNLLETMVERRKPTRAEVHDVINTIVDGAMGLTLAAETAIGKYPLQCINMVNRLIHHGESVAHSCPTPLHRAPLVELLEASNYLLDSDSASGLVAPHGGKLVNRVRRHADLSVSKSIELDDRQRMEVEQIAVGTYSPLEGFMGSRDFQSVLSDLRLADGTVWPLPIVLDVRKEIAKGLKVGELLGLKDSAGETFAVLELTEKYTYDKEKVAQQIYGTTSMEHPGVRLLTSFKPVLLAGPISLLRRGRTETMEYELSPKQVRRLFEERGWVKVLGFHTRNVIHKGHEFIQLTAIEKTHCDGLFVHPVAGSKKPGDFNSKYILQSYAKMSESFYPPDKVVLAAFSTYSRYAGPREALFTALCRKNFGCSHFIVGRDHTGVGTFYDPEASHRIFDEFPDLGIEAVRFDEVFYSNSAQAYVHRRGLSLEGGDRLTISASEARSMFQQGLRPPNWFMRPEISDLILDAIEKGEQVFVRN